MDGEYMRKLEIGSMMRRRALFGLLLATVVCSATAQRSGGGRPFGRRPGMQRTDLVARYDGDGDGRTLCDGDCDDRNPDDDGQACDQ